jgi:hypothetical protein
VAQEALDELIDGDYGSDRFDRRLIPGVPGQTGSTSTATDN